MADHSSSVDPEIQRQSAAAAVSRLSGEELTPVMRAAVDALLAEIEGLKARLEESEERARHLAELADRDTMLPIANRRAFMRELERAISRADRYELSGAVLFCDLNNLKGINDAYGHAAGDEALAQIAAVLSENLRKSDTVARLGGDEFGIILAQAADADSMREKGIALARAVAERPLVRDGAKIRLSIAVGGYRLRPGDTADAALAAADEAMFADKRRMVGDRARR